MHEDNEYICSNCGRLAELHPILSEEGDCYDPKPPRVMQTEDAPDSAPPHCPSCGYTKEDAQFNLDHHLCKNAGKAPWEAQPVADIGGALPALDEVARQEIYEAKDSAFRTDDLYSELDKVRAVLHCRERQLLTALDNYNTLLDEVVRLNTENAELRRKLATPGETAWIEIESEICLDSSMEVGRYMGTKWVITRLESSAKGWAMIHPNDFYTHYRYLNPPTPPEATQ